MVRRVAFALTAAGAIGFALLAARVTAAEHDTTPAVRPLALLAQNAKTDPPPQPSFECRVKSPVFEGSAPLRQVRSAIRSKRAIRVLAIGSSSTVGIGASSPVASYPVRLENDLEGLLKGFDVEMTSRGVSGEIADAASERMKREIADVRPDLVVWQVGTNDAMARVNFDDFAHELRETLRWLASSKVDVVLIDPQYVERLAHDPEYTGIVEVIAKVASEERVLLVNRFDTMADLAKIRGNGTYLARDQFHLNDLGYRCMAEYAARAIVAGIIEADTEAARRN